MFYILSHIFSNFIFGSMAEQVLAPAEPAAGSLPSNFNPLADILKCDGDVLELGTLTDSGAKAEGDQAAVEEDHDTESVRLFANMCSKFF